MIGTSTTIVTIIPAVIIYQHHVKNKCRSSRAAIMRIVSCLSISSHQSILMVSHHIAESASCQIVFPYANSDQACIFIRYQAICAVTKSRYAPKTMSQKLKNSETVEEAKLK